MLCGKERYGVCVIYRGIGGGGGGGEKKTGGCTFTVPNWAVGVSVGAARWACIYCRLLTDSLVIVFPERHKY
jgi:hypothetical protein